VEFYVYLNGATRGPFTEERVERYLADGLLRPLDLVATSPDGELKPLEHFRRARFGETQARTNVVSAGTPATSPPVAPASEQPAPAHGVAHADLPRVPAASLGPYSRSTLAPNETAYLRTSLHWIVFVRYGLLALVLVLFVALPFAIAVQALSGSEIGWFALPLPVFVLVPPTVAFASSELVITNMRVLIKTGVIRRQTLEMFVSKIESIAVDQGFFGRLFDYGTVLIRGTGGFQEPFEAIARPIEFRNYVQRLQSGSHPIATGASVA
jgi:hypothetical protein